jgi:hypothetical protein
VHVLARHRVGRAIRGAGELTRIALVERCLPEAPCAALVSTLALEALVDLAFAAVLLGAAVALGLVPGLPGGPSASSGLALATAAPKCVLLYARALLGKVLRELRRSASELGARRLLIRHVLPWLGASWLLRLGRDRLFPTGILARAVSGNGSRGAGSSAARGARALLVGGPRGRAGADRACALGSVSPLEALSFGMGMDGCATCDGRARKLPMLMVEAAGGGAR